MTDFDSYLRYYLRCIAGARTVPLTERLSVLIGLPIFRDDPGYVQAVRDMALEA